MQAELPPRLPALNACPGPGPAAKIAAAPAAEEPAACAQALPGARSCCHREGAADNAAKRLLFTRTTVVRRSQAARRVRTLHPYELPGIIAVPLSVGLPEYLRWMDSCTMNPDAD